MLRLLGAERPLARGSPALQALTIPMSNVPVNDFSKASRMLCSCCPDAGWHTPLMYCQLLAAIEITPYRLPTNGPCKFPQYLSRVHTMLAGLQICGGTMDTSKTPRLSTVGGGGCKQACSCSCSQMVSKGSSPSLSSPQRLGLQHHSCRGA